MPPPSLGAPCYKRVAAGTVSWPFLGRFRLKSSLGSGWMPGGPWTYLGVISRAPHPKHLAAPHPPRGQYSKGWAAGLGGRRRQAPSPSAAPPPAHPVALALMHRQVLPPACHALWATIMTSRAQVLASLAPRAPIVRSRTSRLQSTALLELTLRGNRPQPASSARSIRSSPWQDPRRASRATSPHLLARVSCCSCCSCSWGRALHVHHALLTLGCFFETMRVQVC